MGIRVPKLLILADTNRLDTSLTIAQMQGKFQMSVLPQASSLQFWLLSGTACAMHCTPAGSCRTPDRPRHHRLTRPHLTVSEQCQPHITEPARDEAAPDPGQS